MNRRKLFLVSIATLGFLNPAGVSKAEEEAWTALKNGAIVLFRHANAPGTGDPANFKIGDCSTQRNLDARGREQAARIGESFRTRSVTVSAVWTSQWCRARDTADLAFPGLAIEQPAFNSFFGNREQEPEQTAAAMEQLGRWKGPGALAIFTHQVNITALTGVVPASGEGIVVHMSSGKPIVLGQIRP